MAAPFIVTYLHHSGFMVAAGRRLLVFDYYSNPSEPALAKRLRRLVADAAAGADRITLLASHQHHDHYDPEIWRLDLAGRPCDTVLSDDISGQAVPAGQEPFRMKAGDSLQLGDLRVSAFGSTDAGVSFLVEQPGLRLFHAGDLNWWNWIDESTPDELVEYERDFRAVIGDLQPAASALDCVFFPVDPRLGTVSHCGAEIFLQTFHPAHFFPMHFAWDYAETDRFSAMMAPRFPDTVIHTIQQSGDCFRLE
ncbi:MAG: MBL fold metallo-hydrolase [Eubacteriales bacterium]|nr:MBL fold metallo-hydrolase [Eubacteriales bacterium]